MTELAPLGLAALAPEEVPEWVGQEGEEWMAPEQLRAQAGSASVFNAKLLLLMKQECRATLLNVQNAVRRWLENKSQGKEFSSTSPNAVNWRLRWVIQPKNIYLIIN